MNTQTLKLSKLTAVYAIGAAILCGAARAEEPVGVESDAEAGVALKEEKTAVVSGKFSLAFDSKYMSYGLVDNKDPILTPSAELTFFDVFYLGVESIFDTTRYGRRAGYTSRAWQYTELHANAGLCYTLSPEDFEWLPTSIDLSLDYQYEFHPNSKRAYDEDGNLDKSWMEDTQFWCFSIGLPDVWFEPVFYYERDVMRDEGTYLNLEIGHEFTLIKDTLTLRPSLAQGWGDQRRVTGYLDVNDGALMDTCAKLTLTWTICEHLKLSCYGAYYDYLFCGDGIRDDVRGYEATGDDDHTWNFVGGLALTASF